MTTATDTGTCPCGNPGSPYYARTSRLYGPTLCHDCWETAAFDPGRRATGNDGGNRPAPLAPVAEATAETGAEPLDWGNNSKLRGKTGPPAPCVICDKPAIVRGPNGNPCHKTCAEENPERFRMWLSPDTAVRRRAQEAE